MSAQRASPEQFRAALEGVPVLERDAWLDRFLGLGELPDDGPELPRGCVPYLPSPVDVVLQMVDAAHVSPADVFVDVGSGLGRVTALTHLLTGATVVGIEIQSELAQRSRELAARLGAERVSVLEGDAAALAATVTDASVFFLYCPFSGARLDSLLDELEPIARARPIHICSVDLPLPELPWLEPVWRDDRLIVCRSV